MLRPESFAASALLTGLVAFGPLSTDMYLPSLPTMMRDLNADVGQVQLTLSVFLVGFALGQLLYGPLSDRFGRRHVLMGGIAIYVAASVACVLAPTIGSLITARFFQALGACAGPVLARAVVRDVHGREGAARILAYMGTAMALAPMFMPTVGGYLVMGFGWQAIFIFLTVYSATLLTLVASQLKETNAWKNPRAVDPGTLIGNYLGLFASRVYVGYILTHAFVYCGLFAFISGSSFVFIEFLGLAPNLYGICFGTVIAGYMAGTVIAGRLTLKVGIDRMCLAGGFLSLVSGSVLAGLAWSGVATVAAVMIPMFAFMISMGVIMPNAMAGAIGPFPKMAGAASALMGFVQMTLAAGIGLAVGQLDDGTQIPMTTAVAVMGWCAFLSFVFLIGLRKR
jgi:MFS transporter, DHA1 family, multidrug resistance protein